jgi:hypothetical protein
MRIDGDGRLGNKDRGCPEGILRALLLPLVVVLILMLVTANSRNITLPIISFFWKQ